MDELVRLQLGGSIVQSLALIEPQLFRKFIFAEHYKAVYVTLRKVCYGIIQAMLVFWKKLTSQLMTMGFKTNPYNACVANKLINRTTCTIIWHVDDIKISHTEKLVGYPFW
jgi:hypothetical protein